VLNPHEAMVPDEVKEAKILYARAMRDITHCIKTPTNLSSSSTRREHFFASTSISGCGFSAPEEMQGEHHYTDYQQHVNQGTGNVKREETKQPKNNQNCRNCS